MPGVIGRDDEQRLLTDALEAVDAGRGALVEVVGDAGVGKSALLAAFVGGASSAGATVWRAAPTWPEASLPWAGLALLIGRDGATAELVDTLPSRAREQLRAATTLAGTEPVDATAVAFGFAALLVAATEAGRPPLVVVLDDVQWLDPASAAAIAHALHGIVERRCLAVAGRRAGAASALDLPRLAGADGMCTIELGGLGLDDLGEMLAAHGVALARPDVRRVHARTAGNPLYGLEVGRAVAAGRSLDDALRLPSLQATIGARVTGLPDDARVAVGAAALLATPLVATIGAVLEGADALAALAPAEEAGLVRVRSSDRGDIVVFNHPLFAAVAVDALSTHQARSLHRVLADTASDLGERAMHRARADPGVDADVADLLEHAADAASERGAVTAAIEHAAACVAATPGDDTEALLRRRLQLAALQTTDGRHQDARATLEATDVAPGSAGETAVAHALVIPIAVTAGIPAGGDAARRALALPCQPDPHAKARTAQLFVLTEMFVSIDRARAAAEMALGAVGDDTSPSDRVGAELGLLRMRVLAGEPVDADAAIAANDSVEHPSPIDGAPNALAYILAWLEDPRADARLDALLRSAVELGSRAAEDDFCGLLAALEVPRGDWVAAERHLRQSMASAPDPTGATLWALGLLVGSTGRATEADRLMERASTTLRAPIDRLSFLHYSGALGLARGDVAGAAGFFGEALQLGRDVGLRSVRSLPFRRDAVEALVAAGRLDDAAAAAADLAADGERCGLDAAKADGAAAQAVVASAAGDFEAARAAFATAVKLHDQAGLVYEAARTRLAAGATERRAGRRSDARAVLAEAKQAFEAMGAVLWARRATDELGRLGTRSSSSLLTATEEQVAELVVAGRTNAEIAAALFVSVRTVESNLTRIYRKLGVRSRTELAARRMQPG